MQQPLAHPRRRFNDDRERIFSQAGRLIAFVCECMDPDCTHTVLLSGQEYEALRPGPIVHEGHRAAP